MILKKTVKSILLSTAILLSGCDDDHTFIHNEAKRLEGENRILGAHISSGLNDINQQIQEHSLQFSHRASQVKTLKEKISEDKKKLDDQSLTEDGQKELQLQLKTNKATLQDELNLQKGYDEKLQQLNKNRQELESIHSKTIKP
ncbi:MAG: hypothetical protein EU981_01975 [Candidatus Liberibacter ctenarytainae]|uniref:Lipoprotein n=1 Tax=Candidatus Liberibacter ctenarytainae TaxID=2020335 RepID=A0A937AJJ0_9HYPH|nr:hypothetical protein [Candidatus Liberibacter ctenarytainae]